MEEWKFLLQKDGDRSWLPLDSPDIEILEGRYRIVAHACQPNTDISIRICHLATEEDPPKRRIQKRSNRTNAGGLMVVIPFTRLQAGMWEVSCFSTDPMSDLLGDTLHHSVRLQVSACVSEETEDWNIPQPSLAEAGEPCSTRSDHSDNSDLSSTLDVKPEALQAANSLESTTAEAAELTPAISISSTGASSSPQNAPTFRDLAALNVEIAEALGLSMDRLVEMTEQLSHQLIDEVFQEFDLISPPQVPMPDPPEQSSSTPLFEETVASTHQSNAKANAQLSVEPEVALDSQVLVEGAALCIVLDQEVLVARRDQQPLVVSGRLEADRSELDTETAAGFIPVQDGSNAKSSFDIEFDIESDSEVDESQSQSQQYRAPDRSELKGAVAQEIQIYLRDPQSSKVLASDRQSLPTNTLPFAFTFSLNLPAGLTTHLVLGEVLLCGTPPEASQPVTLKSQSFTVTVDPESLVEELNRVNAVLAERSASEDSSDLTTQFCTELLRGRNRPLLDLSFLKLTETSTEPRPTATEEVALPVRQAVATATQILPPQLYQPDPALAGKRSLELPKFVRAHPELVNSSGIVPEATAVFADDLTELESMILSEPVLIEESIDSVESVDLPKQAVDHSSDQNMEEPDGSVSESTFEKDSNAAEGEADQLVLPTDSTLGEGDDETNTEADRDTDSANQDAPDDVQFPAKTAFQALRLQDRFLNRLSSLASDTELSALLKAFVPPTKSPSAQEIIEAPPQTLPTLEACGAIAQPEGSLAEEVVAEDDPAWQQYIQRVGFQLNRVPVEMNRAATVDNSPEPVDSLVLPSDQPVPAPVLEAFIQEVLAGKPINLRIKLPNVQPKIYVKLWVNDRQTRSLLDGPRWLVDFLPNGFGELEAATQLTAPLGSLEVRIEAIAVEMHTQRESQKVSLDCTVLPPDLPERFLDELEELKMWS